ncbi:MAG: hypothetical protein EOM55_02215 [Clostridia bacterium]|nr:hypothetical protein [Clostridia bacterium]
MKADVLLGLIVGMFAGATVVTLCKPARDAVKNGTEMMKKEAINLMEKGTELVKSEAKNMTGKQKIQSEKD